MRVMLSRPGSGIMKKLYKKYPEKIGFLQSPSHTSISAFEAKYPYIVDNDCFLRFSEEKLFKILDLCLEYHPPIFFVCPDVWGCHDRTKALWNYYYPKLKKRYNLPMAFVIQDGCSPEDIPKNADWLFSGGKDPWKMENLHRFVGLGKPVHVGRVNTLKRVRYCEQLGIESFDGSAWLKFRGKNYRNLFSWLEEDHNYQEKKETQLCLL